MAEKGSSGITQVAIAIIGVLGSLGVAYITTGAKFQSEVEEARLKITEFGKQVNETKQSAQGIESKLTSQQGEVDQRIAELKRQLSDAENKNKEFQDQLASLRNDIDSSKQKVAQVNTVATAAINNIQAAESRIKRSALPVRPMPTP